MASAVSYSTVLLTTVPMDQLLQTFLNQLSNCGAAVTLSGPNTIVVTRRYTPEWAVVVGVLGLLLFLLGVLAFFIKETEVVTIALTPEQPGTRLVISGIATPHIAGRINSVVEWCSKQPA